MLACLALTAACADDTDSPDEPAAGTGGRGGSTSGRNGTGGSGGNAGGGGQGNAGAGGAGGSGPAGGGGSAGGGESGSAGVGNNAGAAGSGGGSASGGGAGSGGGGAGSGGGPGGSGGGALCSPGHLIIAGSVAGVPIGGDTEIFSSFFNGGAGDLALMFDQSGRVYTRAPEAPTPGEPTTATSLLQLNAGAQAAGQNFVCSGEGSLTYDDDTNWKVHAASLASLGPCPGGAPVAGEVALQYDENFGGEITSTIEGSSFTASIFGLVGTTSEIDPYVDFELFPSDGGSLFFSFQNLAPTVDLAGGYFIVPSGNPDAGAVYCAGPGSTVTTVESEFGLEPSSASLKNLTRLGTCAEATPVAGEIDFCASSSP